ncbi:MAG: SPOR domain-containing protein [Ignavibacteriales bacterium]|nr:SPOR domain-containing protein [Ignavibacteriales bacterium]
MPGFQRILKNNFFRWTFISYLLVILLVSCKTTKEIEKKDDSDRLLREFLVKYEKTFDPSVYDEDIQLVLEEEKREREAIEAAKVITIAPPETILGFRVQILFTPEIDQANQARDEITSLLPEEWSYVVYDAPYYKIRIGNFKDRAEANLMVRRLVGLGYKDAWIVPDKIIKNPPPRPPEIFIEPEKQPEPRR